MFLFIYRRVRDQGKSIMSGAELSLANPVTNPTIDQLLIEYFKRQQIPKVHPLFEWEETEETPKNVYRI